MFKVIFDKTAAFFAIVVLFPLLLLISLLIKLNMGSPVFFIQKRIGKNGIMYKMIKFRTMNNNNINSSTISIAGENRITKLGAVLRKYKLDELPELINVLKGEMSLVGPRPDVPGYADKLEGEDRVVLNLKPGITGLASLKYRNEEQFLANQINPHQYNDNIIWPDKVRINKWYAYNCSTLLDLKIIFHTLFPLSFDVDRFIKVKSKK